METRRQLISKLPFFATCALFTLLLAAIPSVTIENEVDLSLCSILNHAAETHLQFGIDIVSTYGPLGFLIFPCYSAYLGSLRLLVDAGLGLLIALGLCRLAWRLPIPKRVVMLAVLAWAIGNVQWKTDLIAYIGLFCWALLCVIERKRALAGSVIALSAFVAFIALAKISFLIAGSITLIFIICDLFARRRIRLAAAATAVFIGVFVAGWLATGQQLRHLGPLIQRSIAVAQAYNEALALNGSPQIVTLGAVFFVLAWVLTAVRAATCRGEANERLNVRAVLLGCWTAVLGLIVFKYGFVHQDTGHIATALTFIPVMVLAIDALPSGSSPIHRWTRVGAVAMALVAGGLLQFFFFEPLPKSLMAPLRLAWDNAACVVQPGAYEARMNDLLETVSSGARLPTLSKLIGRGTVDVFGQFQADALFNNLEYHPRPVPQTYQVGNETMARLNEDFYSGTNAPDYVLFNLKPMDGRLAPLEDSRTLLHLIANYRVVAAEGRYLLMKSVSQEGPSLRLLEKGEAQPGKAVDLRSWTNSQLWLEVRFRPSFLGTLRQIVYRPPALRLALWQEPSAGLLVRRPAPASMLAAGFLLNPLFMNTEGLQAYDAARQSADQTDAHQAPATNGFVRPGAFSLEIAKSEEAFWTKTASYRIYEIENRLPPVPISKTSSGARSPPFTLFPRPLWVSTEFGGVEDTLGFVKIAALPLVFAGLLLFFRLWRKSRAREARLVALIAGNCLVLLFLLSVLLLAAETWCRYFYDTTDAFGSTRVCQRWMYRHWQTNSCGVRDNMDYSPRLTPGKHRVTFLGDSFTAGHGIKDIEARFPNLIRKDHPELEIHVLADPGLDTGGEIKLMKKAFAKGYEVDQVVLVYCLNDTGDLLTAEGQPFHGIFDQVQGSPWFAKDSDFLDLVFQRYRASRIPGLRDYFSFVKAGYQDATWQEQKARLTELRDLIRDHGGRLFVVTFPFMHALGPSYDYQFVHDELDQFWRDSGVPHLDLLTEYKNIAPGRLTVNRHDAHPNELANRLAAEAIERFLKSNSPAP